MRIGIQLYSVRDVAEKNLEEAVKLVSELGYTSIEFAGFFGTPAKDVSAMLEKYGIGLSGTHSGFNELVENLEETIAYHKAIGNKYFIIPGWDLSSQEKIDDFVEKVNKIQKRLEAEGITLGYHNHTSEFIPNTDGSLVFDQLFYRTNLKFEIDTYWAFVAMKHPVELLERVHKRVIFIHLKDGSSKGEGYVLGKGEAPLLDIITAAKKYEIPMVVESETLTPDGPTEAKLCIEYLRTIGL